MKLELVLDRGSNLPLTDQIVNGVVHWLQNHAVGAGVKLPSIRRFAADQGVSRYPVIEAYDRLVALGHVESRHGSGFYVASHHHQHVAAALGLADPRRAEHESEHILEQLNHPSESLKLGSGFIPEIWRDKDGLGRAIRHVSRTEGANLADYASQHGYPGLRVHLLHRIAQLGIEAQPSQILLTQGASQALDLLMRYMLKPGDTMFVEDPGYYSLFGLLKLHGVKLVGIPRTRIGPDLDVLEAQLKQHRPKLFFVNTVFHNPTGTTVAPQVAFRLLQLAREHGVTLIEDDIYADFQATPTDRLATLDQLEHVIYVGGLSKTLSSSLRVGYVLAPPSVIKDLADIKMLTSLGGSRFIEAVAAAMLERGTYRKYLEKLRLRIQYAIGATVQMLESCGWELFEKPVGGTFIWARLPHIDDSTRLAEYGAPRGVTIAPGRYFRPNAEKCPWIRINVAYAGDPRAQAFFQSAALLRP
ncbi:GntR family transcriptional regulator [Burkholderia ubonensis]|uniref:aminotransferase-like domain-containing protein n=1 Tax=Burkholderia ubonensis TaxID=101571 RepID=UPI00075B1553|nr:PLP-dependent aminotransferase family protein [Burkholderia ubonensis]KVD39538.1 GntR family transcriptional regulator [Burkholderia ubonensis]